MVLCSYYNITKILGATVRLLLLLCASSLFAACASPPLPLHPPHEPPETVGDCRHAPPLYHTARRHDRVLAVIAIYAIVVLARSLADTSCKQRTDEKRRGERMKEKEREAKRSKENQREAKRRIMRRKEGYK